MSDTNVLKYTTDLPPQNGLYWEKFDRFNGVRSFPAVSYRFKDEGFPDCYEGHGVWSIAGPLRYPKASEFTKGIPVEPGSYLQLIDGDDGEKIHLPFVVLPVGSEFLPEGSKYEEMTYYGPFPEPEE